MIVDCHAHVFENWHGACGHPTVDTHLNYIQKNVTRPAAKTVRRRDGKPASAAMLIRPGHNTWAGLEDVYDTDIRPEAWSPTTCTSPARRYG